MSRARDFADLAGSADAGVLTGKNLLINGQFQCWQRGNSITANNSNAYTADRWHAGANGSEDVVYSRQFTNTSDGTPYMRVRRTGTASGRMYLTQMIETSVLDFCRGKTVTLSFQARKHADFDATFVSRIATQTNESPRDDNVVQNSDVTRTLTTSFQTFTQSLTLTSSSNSANGFRVEFVAEDGANSSSNYYYEVRDVQLEIGNVATPIEHRSFANELTRCHRYAIRYTQGFNERAFVGSFGNATNTRVTIHPYVPMRSTPTMTVNDNGESLRDFVSWFAASSASLISSSTNEYINVGVVHADTGLASGGNTVAWWGGFDIVLDAEL
jgi:hypothetical protein